MALPGLPTNVTEGQAGHLGNTNTVHTVVNAFDTTIGSVAATGNVPTWDGTKYSPASPGIGTEVLFSSLPGANDDAKLTSFMSAQSALTMKGKTLVLDEQRDYTFTVADRVLYNGFSIKGPDRPQDQARGSMPLGNRILLRMTGSMFVIPAGNTFGCSFQGLSLDGQPGNRLIGGSEATTGGVLWTSVFRDISIQNAGGVLGQAGNKLLLTASTIDGWWNVNNVADIGFYIGGSDCFINPSEMLLDSPTTMLPLANYLFHAASMSNTWISNIYCTAEQHSGLRIEGGSSTFFSRSVWEGRNAGQPCYGSLIRMSAGNAMLRESRLAFAMAAPASQTGHTDVGVINVTGGQLIVDGCTYERATGVAETVPFIYASGTTTRVRVRNIMPIGTWTGLPVVRQLTAGLIDADNSVTVVTG